MKRAWASGRIAAIATMKDWTLQRTISTTAGVVAGTDLMSDPTSDISGGRRNSLSGSGGVVQTGIIIRSGVGGYDCAVRIGGREIGCQIASNIMAPTYGYSMGFVPPEGSRVVVVLPSRSALRGIVVGVIPLGWMVTPNTKKKQKVPLLFSRVSAGYSHYGAFSTPVSNEKYSSKVTSPNNRPPDVLHGEMVLKNENSCGFFGGVFSGNMSGGGAFIKTSRIDDLVRVRSANYERWSDETSLNEYNDWAYLSSEEMTFSYQGERMGDKGLTTIGPIVGSSVVPVITHPRIKKFSGALASAETKIVERPEQSRITKDTRSKKQEDEGVFLSHVGEAGELIYRSAGGLSIERYDRIPSVRRIRKPYDPEGDKEVKREPIKPFNHDKEDPAFGPLELFDALAWEQKGVYQRFDEQEKDFKTQEEQDIKTPQDSNNDPAGSSSNMQQNAKKRCGIYLGQNGGITIRDAWGSEISLVGGNIYLSAPGSIVMTANKSIVSLAKDANVVKSKNIVALESMKYTEIRGVSYVNIHGGYTGGNGGVLIESFGTVDATNSPKGKGHDPSTQIHGITLKSESGVNFKAAKLRATVDEHIAIGCGKEGKRDGKILLSSGDFAAVMEHSAILSTEKSALSVQESNTTLVSEGNISLLAKGNIGMIHKTEKALVPIETDSKTKPVDPALNKIKTKYNELDPKEIVKPYTWNDYKEKICSQLGKSTQYKSNSSLDLKGGKFRMYSPYWHTMKNDGNEFVKSASPEPWPEYRYPVYDNMAWPGKESWDGGEFVVLEKSVNLVGGHYSKKRDALSDSTKVKAKNFKDYFRV